MGVVCYGRTNTYSFGKDGHQHNVLSMKEEKGNILLHNECDFLMVKKHDKITLSKLNRRFKVATLLASSKSNDNKKK